MLAPCPAGAQLLEHYYPVGIPGQHTWLSDAVADRPHTEYDPLGVRAGSFVIRPSLSESLGYDSNILGTTDAVGSAFSDTRGTVRAASDWSRDALGASVGFDRRQYLQHANASYTDWTAGLGGEFALGDDRATLAALHVTATTVSAQVGTLSPRPVTVAFDTARAGYLASFGRVTLEPALTAASYRFSGGGVGGGGLGGGETEAANNRDTATGALTAGYELAPASNLVLVASGTHAAYTTNTPGLPTPDYDDAALVGGIDTRGGTLVRARATLGYQWRSYDDARLTGTSAPLAEIDVVWTPTRLTTVTGRLSHSLQNAIVTGGAISYAYTDLRVVLDHELRRDLLLQGFGEVQNAGYRMHDGTQRVVSAGASVTWLLNRTLSMVGSVGWWRSRDAVDTTLNQTRGVAELALDCHL